MKKRFKQLLISEKCLNSRLDLRNEISARILKICIGGAFFPKYAKADYKNGDQLKRVKTSGFLTPE